MKKINIRPDENIFIMSDKEIETLKQALLTAMKTHDDAYQRSGERSSDKSTADKIELILDKL